MIKLSVSLIFTLLILVTVTKGPSETELIHLIPPAALVNQPYSFRFNVLGLDSPKYEFHGLPSQISGSNKGILEGTPNKVGSYPILIVYTQNGCRREEKSIFLVVTKMWPEFEINKQITLPDYPPILVYLQSNSTMFMFGEDIKLKVSAVGGKPPYVFTYLRMSDELQGDSRSGIIRGFFQLQGSYTFGVNVADSIGNSADIFLTVNIQPMTFFGRYTIDPLIVRNIYSLKEYDWKCFLEDLNKKKQQFQWLYCEAKKAKQFYDNMKNYLPYFQNKLVILEKHYQTSLKAVQIHQQNVDKIQKVKSSFFSQLQKAKIFIKQTTDKFINSQQLLKNSESNLEKQKDQVNLAQKLLKNKTEAHGKSQAEAYAAAKNQRNVDRIYREEKIIADQNKQKLQAAKDALNSAQRQLKIQQPKINNLQNKIIMIKAEKARAQAQFTLVSDRHEKAGKNLKDAQELLKSLRIEQQKTKEDIGISKYKLQSALNNLSVAQAAKKQADRLQNMAKMFGVSSDQVQFAGCSQLCYPSFSGAAVIESINGTKISLTSGQIILQGNCTQGIDYGQGDLIQFEGYLKEGCIHAVRLSKLVPQ